MEGLLSPGLPRLVLIGLCITMCLEKKKERKKLYIYIYIYIIITDLYEHFSLNFQNLNSIGLKIAATSCEVHNLHSNYNLEEEKNQRKVLLHMGIGI